jgi:hypothetical protein
MLKEIIADWRIKKEQEVKEENLKILNYVRWELKEQIRTGGTAGGSGDQLQTWMKMFGKWTNWKDVS